MKIKSLLLLLIGCAGVSFSATAIIDFGTGSKGGNPYGNQIVGNLASDVINDLLALGTGASTGWKLTVTGLRGDAPDTNVFMPGSTLWSASPNKQDFSDFSKSLGLSGDLSPDAWRDSAFLGNSVSTVFTLSGLTPGKEYVISFGLGRKGGGGSMNIGLTKGTLESGSWFGSAGGKGDSSLSSLTFGAAEAWVATYKVAADANGEIAFDFSKVQYGAVGFMTVSLPEPSGVMLGMVGMVGFLFRRKR